MNTLSRIWTDETAALLAVEVSVGLEASTLGSVKYDWEDTTVLLRKSVAERPEAVLEPVRVAGRLEGRNAIVLVKPNPKAIGRGA